MVFSLGILTSKRRQRVLPHKTSVCHNKAADMTSQMPRRTNWDWMAFKRSSGVLVSNEWVIERNQKK